DTTRFMVAGGCSDVAMQACSGPELASSRVYSLGDDGRPLAKSDVGPNMAAHAIGAQLFDLGIAADGNRTFVMARGSDPPGDGNRFVLLDPPPNSPPAQLLGGLHAQHAALDGGAVLSAFDLDGAPPTGGAAVVTPAGGVVPLSAAPTVDGMRLVA